jgi:division protein CdvB (Snf7/Vps24/ESCRT-III family)
MIRERGYSWAGRGPITVIHPTEKEAQANLVDYVRKNWDDKMNEDPPEDDYELVEEYFDQVLEEYDIAEAARTTSTGTAGARRLRH